MLQSGGSAPMSAGIARNSLPFLWKGADMDKTDVIEIMKELVVVLHALSGYPVAERLPEVHVMPQAVIAELVCEGPCRIQAFYHPDFGVFIDEKLELKDDAFAQSIVLHELVHHAQEISGRFEQLPSECHRRTAAESEAYEIQNRFLAQRDSPQRIPYRQFARACPDH